MFSCKGITSLPSTVGHNNLIPWNTHDRRKITSNKTEVTKLPNSQQLIHNLLNEANDLQRSLFRQ